MSNVLETKNNFADRVINNFTDLQELIEKNPKIVREEFGMNRQEFRKVKRDNERTLDILNSLSKKQRETMQMMLRTNEKYYVQRISDYTAAFTASVNAVLGEMVEGFGKDAATQFWDEVNAFVAEHMEKTEKRVITKRELEELEKNVKEFIFKALEEGKEAKVIKEELAFKFNSLSKAQIKNAYAEAKEEFEAANEIVDILDEPKKTKVKKAKKEVKVNDPVKVELIEVSEEEAKELKKEVVEEMNDMTITGQLQEKLNLLAKDTEVINIKIDELRQAILEQESNKVLLDSKREKVEQMIQLAKEIE